MAETNDGGGPEDLLRYLQQSREGLVRSVEGLSDYDARRPMTPTATNLLGLVKHLAGVEIGYLGESVGRPFLPRPPFMEDDVVWDSGDMWATPQESMAWVLDLYRQVWAHSDASVREFGLAAPATVAWWSPEKRDSTLGSLLVRCVDETARHAGHADILRELVDEQGGRDRDDIGDRDWWARHLARVTADAESFREG